MRKIFVAENEAGEWTVADLVLDYRVCAFNVDQHGGAHIHHPLDEPAGPVVRIASTVEARAIITDYARRAARYDPTRFQEVVKAWRSAWKND